MKKFKIVLSLFFCLTTLCCTKELKEKREVEQVEATVSALVIYEKNDFFKNEYKKIVIKYGNKRTSIIDDKLFDRLKVGDKIKMQMITKVYVSSSGTYQEVEMIPVKNAGIYQISKKR